MSETTNPSIQTDFRIQELTAEISKLQNTIESQKTEIERLNQILHNFQQHRFGAHSEKTKYIMPSPEQPMLFNEAEICRETTEPESETEAIRIDVKSYQRKSKRTKAELTKDLPQKDIYYELPEEALHDEEGNHYEYVSTNLVRNEMMIIPKQILVINHYQKVYKADITIEGVPATKFLKAPVPKAVLPHSIANAATIANIMAEKYVNGLPLYRQEAEWNNKGIDFRRNTMANWIIRSVDYYLKDVYFQLIAELKKQDVIHADETPVQVLKEDGKTPESKSYMWVYSSAARNDRQIRIFDYKSSRSGKNAKEFLEDYHNVVVSDAFSGYNKIANDVIRAGCWAHVRRKWKEAMPAGATPENSSAARGFKFCSRIFSIEKRLKELPDEERLKARTDQVKPVVDEYWKWLDELIVDSNSKLGEAVTYSKNQKEYLNRFLEYGNIDISNNQAENAIRPFVIGRKNWLFCDTVGGAFASSVVYSLVETAKANNLDPYQYLLLLLTELPQIDGPLSAETLESFLPWNAAAACANLKYPF